MSVGSELWPCGLYALVGVVDSRTVTPLSPSPAICITAWHSRVRPTMPTTTCSGRVSSMSSMMFTSGQRGCAASALHPKSAIGA